MTTGQAILLDHLVALLCIAAWFATGVAAAIGRVRLGLGLLVAAVLVTLSRVATVAMLAGRGWWFVQEKVLLGLPMLGVAGLAAVLIAGRPLIEARRTPDKVLPASSVVALLTAAYAALAVLVVTLLVGYPLTWGTSLITVSIVCLGALLTARVVAADANDAAHDGDPATALAPDARPGFSRRRFISVAGGAVVVGAGSAGAGLSFLPAESATAGGGAGRLFPSRAAVSVADLRGARSPEPGGTSRRHILTAQTATVRLASGREIDAWTYDGQLPGPAITATEGDLIEVTLRNADIADGATVHWHGYDVACGEDGAPGVTQHVVMPGEEFVYHFRADQVGTYWYHTHQASHRGVRRGLYGTLVVNPRDRQAVGENAAEERLNLTLPVHTFDGTVVIGDRDGRAEYTAAAGTPVQLRLINTDSDPHWFALAGTSFQVAAVDGRDLKPTRRRQGRRTAPGGRRPVRRGLRHAGHDRCTGDRQQSRRRTALAPG